MTIAALSPPPGRPLPGLLKHGDQQLGLPRLTMEQRMRAIMGVPEPELPVPEFVRPQLKTASV